MNWETKCFYLFVVHWLCSRFVTAKLVRLEKASGLNSVGEHAQKFDREVQWWRWRQIKITDRSTYIHGQSIWNKIDKSINIGQREKSLIFTFACFLTAIAKVKFLEGMLGSRLCIHSTLIFS